MIVTITGASGFVGQNLSQYLSDKNYTVKPLSLRENSWENTIDTASQSIVHLA
ncbi:MAG: nucleoside-diphosphate-sugar epimerase, partial [Flavobacterium psychrophilum]